MGLFSDGSTMYPQGAPQFQNQAPIPMPQAAPPQQPADMPVLNGPNPNTFEAPGGTQQIPTYVGNPLIDKYIHKFIGEELNPGRPATPPNPGRPATAPVAPIRSM